MRNSTYTKPLTFKHFIRCCRNTLKLAENVKELKFGSE